uniref:Uncharacterized protein n=1 Tax=Siphoviridae sp. ctB3v5 TaxID=2826186 RepID=A0A8S5M952_9CAUD|nr:MAG TPA: hypothetical protein [Siphoviridae sp. ctB3v5]
MDIMKLGVEKELKLFLVIIRLVYYIVFYRDILELIDIYQDILIVIMLLLMI